MTADAARVGAGWGALALVAAVVPTVLVVNAPPSLRGPGPALPTLQGRP